MDIYVGNFNFNLKETDIRKLFEVFGDVISVTIVLNKHTGQSKGYGFVHMRNSVEASRAVDELNNLKVAGRNIVVHFANTGDDNNTASDSYTEKQKERFVIKNQLKETLETKTKSFNKIDVDENGYVKITFSR